MGQEFGVIHWTTVKVFSIPCAGSIRLLAFSALIAGSVILPGGLCAQTQLTPDTADLSGFSSSATGIPPKAAEEEAFVVGVGDVLQINVWREPEVSIDSVTVRSDGKISVPLIKEVYVSGLTPLEIEQALTRKFEKLINSPVVTVIVRETHSQQVILSGGVARPGVLEIQPGMTVMHALSIAGGVNEYAKRKKIFVVRGTGSEQVTIPFDYQAVISGKDPSKDFLLEPGDMVVIPE